MRRVMLLALLALALPMALSATAITYNTGRQGTPGGTPPTATGTFTPDFPAGFTATVSCPSCAVVAGTTGGLVTISFSTTTLDCTGAPDCSFTDGNVTVSRGGSELFTSGVTFDPHATTALLLPNQFILTAAPLAEPFSNLFAVGGDLSMGLQFSSQSTGELNNLGGNAVVTVDTVVPEPGTLAMLGTGLIGLAGIARRKLKLPI